MLDTWPCGSGWSSCGGGGGWGLEGPDGDGVVFG